MSLCLFLCHRLQNPLVYLDLLIAAVQFANVVQVPIDLVTM